MKTISARIFALILSALMILALIIPAVSFADEDVICLGSESEKVTPDGTKYTYSWGALPDESPILIIRAMNTSLLEVENDHYVFPVTVKLEKPASVAQDAVPYWFIEEEEREIELEGTSRTFNLLVPKADIDANSGAEDAIVIRWKNGDSILATEMVHYSIVGGGGGGSDPFSSVARPTHSNDSTNRVTITLDPVFKNSVDYEFTEKGDIIFTVKELTKEQIIEAYPGLGITSFLVSATVTAPSGCTKAWSLTGNTDYSSFVNGYTNVNAIFDDRTSLSRGVPLWQIDETESGITVSPSTNRSALYMCWMDDDGNKYPEILKMTVKMGDNAKVISVPEEELKQITDVPKDRLSHGGSGKDIATQAGATFFAEAGDALFKMNTSPDEVVKFAEDNSLNSIDLELWIEAPEEGYDKFVLSTSGGTEPPRNTINSNNRSYAEFGRPIYRSDDGIMTEDVNVVITWIDSTGTRADRIEKFKYKSTFDGITWMDIYWTPAPKELFTTSDAIEDLKAMGFVVEIEDGKVTAYFDGSVLPTIEQVKDLMDTELWFNHSEINGLENAVTFRWNNSSGSGMSTGYNQRTANDQKAIIGNNTATNVSSPCLRRICRLEKKSVGSEGIDYYCAEIDQNEVGLIQFYDNAGALISVSDDNGNAKEGYYYTFEMKPYHYFLNTIVVEEVTAAVTMPTLVLPDSAGKDWKLRTELFTQKNNSGNNPKYYLRLTPVADKEDLKALIEKGADVYIPYSMIKEGLTYEEALNNRTFHVRHYENDEHKKFDNLKGEPTPYGMKFTVTHFSPFVIETVTATDPAPTPGDITNNDNDNGNVQLTPLLPPQTGDDMSSFGAAELVLGAAAFILARRKAR